MHPDEIVALIECYKNFPVLYNPKDENYRKKNKRDEAWNEISHKLMAPVPILKSKMKTVMGTYRSEKSREKRSRLNGSNDVYDSKWFGFKYLEFLGDKVNSDNGEEPIDPLADDVNHMLDSSIGSWGGEASTAASSATAAKKQRTFDPVAKQSELLQKACTYLETSIAEKEEIPTIAKVWGEKLLTLDPVQRMYAEKAVNDVLFEASLGTLHRHSVRIHEGPHHQRPAPPLQSPGNCLNSPHTSENDFPKYEP